MAYGTAAAATGDTPREEAATLKAKGDAYYKAERYSEALECYTESMEQAERDKDWHLYAACIGNIGNIYGIIEDFNRSVYYFKKGLATAVEMCDSDMQSRFITNIVGAYCQMDDAENARKYYKLQMATPFRDIKAHKYYALYNQGMIARIEKNYRLARYYHQECLDYARANGMGSVYVLAQMIEMGGVCQSEGDTEGAIRIYSQCLDSARHIGSAEQEAAVCKKLAGACREAGMAEKAEAYKNRYLSISDSIYNHNLMNVAKNKLFDYENKVNSEQISSLTSRNNRQAVAIVIFAVMVAALSVLAALLHNKNKRLLDAQRLLVSKNKELMKSDEEAKLLREQYIDMMNRQSGNDTADGNDSHNDIGLDTEQINRLLSKITDVMKDIATISRSDFNLNMLAQMVGSNTKYVSWIINDTYGKNFKTFLNEHRIREACIRMSDTEHYGNMTIQAIYEELGYNSAASFIQAFKKVNGMTPSVYQRLARQKEEEA